MKKRAFIKGSLLTLAGVFLSSIKIKAMSESTLKASGIIYSKSDQGKWEGKAGSHAPVVQVEGDQVTVVTEHGMSEKHYIVRHTLVTESGEVIGEKTFYPEDEKAVSTFTLGGKKGKMTATSFCNKHDLWITEFTV
jgi:superoxide reductase